MSPATRNRTVLALLLGGLCTMITTVSARADDQPRETEAAAKPRTAPASRHRARSTNQTRGKTDAKDQQTTTADVPQVDLLEGLRAGDLAVQAEGMGDGRMTL